jgi:hypothetical protein
MIGTPSGVWLQGRGKVRAGKSRHRIRKIHLRECLIEGSQGRAQLAQQRGLQIQLIAMRIEIPRADKEDLARDAQRLMAEGVSTSRPVLYTVPFRYIRYGFRGMSLTTK